MPHLTSSPDHDELIALIGRRLNSAHAVAEWIPSDEADVYRLSFDKGISAKIVKIERSDRWVVRREQVVFPALRAQRLTEFPEVEFTQNDLDVDGMPFMVMPETVWRPWNEIWEESDVLAVWIVERMGDFLRRLRSIDWREIPGAVSPALKSQSVGNWFKDWLAPLHTHASMRGSLEAAMAEILAMLAQEPEGFGGWQGGQVLTDGSRTFTAIDWGNIGAHWPLEDLAGAIAGLNNFSSEAPARLVPVLVSAYTGGLGLTSEEATELRLWQVLWRFLSAAGCLREGQSDEAESQIDAARMLLDGSETYN